MHLIKLALTATFTALVVVPATAQQQRVIPSKTVPSEVQINDKLPPIKPHIPRPADLSVSCSAFIEGLWSWVNQNHTLSAGGHKIGANMAAIKIRERDGTVYPWGHGSYSQGGFGWNGDKLTGRFKVLFSDRRASSGGPRFDASKSDIQDITLFKDGRVEIMLRSWGNTILKLEELKCYRDGFLTGIKREGNGVSMVSFVMRKEVITPGAHPSQLWP